MQLSYDLGSSVTLPTGITVKIAGVGSIRLNDDIIIKNVLYIPDFRLNLLSISHLMKDLNSQVVFDAVSCVIQDRTKGQMIGQGRQVAGLYVLDSTSMSSTVSFNMIPSCSSVVVDVALWHSRLGHPSYDRVDLLKNVLGFNKRNKDDSLHCSTCHLAKQKHLPFNPQQNRSLVAFELVHTDTWGPFSIPTNEGYKYFLTVVDDYSRATWTFLMKRKDEAIQIFPNFVKMVATQFQSPVKSVRSDNAPELKFSDLFKAKGILSYHSCPETPEQNSVVKRKHQHILNVARSLMFQSKVPINYWGDCILSAVFLINRLPSPVLDNKSPFELLHSKAPDYSMLRSFGCLCYQSTSPHQRHKFQPPSKACVFGLSCWLQRI